MGKMLTAYTIERIKLPIPKDVEVFLEEEIPKISKIFKDKFNFENRDDFIMFEKGVVLVCKRNEEITGIFLAFLYPSVFDSETKLLQQQLFYVKPDSGRTAFHLFKKFIDIGKNEADHIITTLTSQTNIKPKTLEKMGFEKLETLYRMEVKRE